MSTLRKREEEARAAEARGVPYQILEGSPDRRVSPLRGLAVAALLAAPLWALLYWLIR